jgi:hypothetical protein
MATTTDPSEPPPAVSAAALYELMAAAPWARRLTRVICLSIAVGLIHAVVDQLRPSSPSDKAVRVLWTAFCTLIGMIFVLAPLRYADAAARLRPDEPATRAEALAAQASCLGWLGITVIVATALAVLALGAAYFFFRMLRWN